MSITATELLGLVAIRGADEAVLKLAAVGKSADTAGEKLGLLATGAVVLAGAGLVAFGVHAVKSFGDFQQGVTQLVTSAGEFSRNTKLVSAGMLQMSVDTATSTDQLEKGMFNVESATYHGAAGLTVLKAAAEGARAENSDLAQTTDVLTTTMHGLHASASQAVPIMDSLIATVADGKMHMNDLTGAMKNVLPVSAALHIKLSDVEGALSTMAMAGDRGSSAGTHLAMMFKMLENPASTASKEMKAMGIDSIKLAETMSTSLPDALTMIQNAVARHFTPGSVEYERAIGKILGGSKSGIAGLELLGDNFKYLTKNTDDAAEALKRGGKDVENWSLIQQNLNFKLDAAKNAVEALFIKVGSGLAPVIGKLLDQVIPLVTQFGDWAVKSGALNQVTQGLQDTLSTTVSTIQTTATAVQTVVGFYQQWQFPINSVALSLSVFFIPALIKSGVEALVSSAKITYGFVASLIAVGVQGWAAGVSLTILIANFLATQIEAAAAAAVVAGQFVASIAKVGVQAAITALTMDANLVPSIVLFASTALLSIGTAITPFVIALGVAATAAWTLAAAVLAVMWPILAAIAAIGLIVLAVNHWSDITNGFNSLWTQFTHNIEQSTHQMKTGVSTDIENMASRSKVAVGNASYDIEASTGRITHATKAMAKQTQIDFKDMDFWAVHNSTDLTSTAKRLFDNMTGHIKGDYSDLDQATKDYWNAIANYIDNKSLLAAQAAQRHFDSIHMPNLTGGQVGTLLHLNASGTTAGGNAEGTDNWRGGLTWVGEKGPELLNIPSGAQIIPNNKIGSVGSAPVIHNHIDVYLDGSRMTGQLMPRIVQQIRDRTGARF